jgi:long-chain fatty acid transport protein
MSPVHAGGPAFTRLFATAEDAVTGMTNPAGMTRLEDSQLLTQSIIANSFVDFKIDRDLTTMDGDGPRGSAPAAVPAIYYVRPMGEDWRLGLSFSIPAGFGASSGSNWAGRYYSDEFSLVFAALNAMTAYRVNDWLSLGGGASLIYSSSASKTAVPNPGLNEPDAKLKTDVSGEAIGWTASTLIEFSEHTRLGISWASEAEADDDLQFKLKDSTLPQPIIDDINALGKHDNLTLRTPQRLSIGGFHDWDNGWSASIDAIWVEFSRFGLSEIGIRDQDLHVPEGNFNDFWIITAGVGFPISDRFEGRAGFLYMQQPVDDEDRTFSFALDEVYGAGFGVQFERKNGHLMDLNLSVFNTGEAPVDTGLDSALTDRGRVAGKNDTPYAATLEFVYHWW